ncbi:MAG: DUF2284 domain-containing protein [Promethearchaeota archaeon]
MANNIDSDLEKLCEYALELGASRVKFFDADTVVVDERVRLKCRVPLCDDCGVHLLCPPSPNVPSVDEMRELLAKYRYAMLIQLDYPISEELEELIRSKDNVSAIYKSQTFVNEYKPLLDRNRNLMHEIINKVEAKAFSMGFYFATGFSSGSCKLCDQCVTQLSGEACRHPFKARPSMEAVGVDTFKTAKNIGFELSPVKDVIRLTGLVLVD